MRSASGKLLVVSLDIMPDSDRADIINAINQFRGVRYVAIRDASALDTGSTAADADIERLTQSVHDISVICKQALTGKNKL